MIGIRIRRPGTGALVLDTTTYTVSTHFAQLVYVTGTGSIQVPGLNSTNFFPMFMPADEIPWIQFGEDTGAFSNKNPAMVPKLYISGDSIVWDCSGGNWSPRNYWIMAMRFA